MNFAALINTQSAAGISAGVVMQDAFQKALKADLRPYDAAKTAACVAFGVTDALLASQPQRAAEALKSAQQAAEFFIGTVPNYTPLYGSQQADAQAIAAQVWQGRSLCKGVLDRSLAQARDSLQAKADRALQGMLVGKRQRDQVSAEQAAHQVYALGAMQQAQNNAQAAQECNVANRANAFAALRQLTGGQQDRVLRRRALECVRYACAEGQVWTASRYLADLSGYDKSKAIPSGLSGLYPVSVAAVAPMINLTMSGNLGYNPDDPDGWYDTEPKEGAASKDAPAEKDSLLASFGKDLLKTATALGVSQVKNMQDEAHAAALAEIKIKQAKALGVPPSKITDDMIKNSASLMAQMQQMQQQSMQMMLAQAQQKQGAAQEGKSNTALIIGGVVLGVLALAGIGYAVLKK